MVGTVANRTRPQSPTANLQQQQQPKADPKKFAGARGFRLVQRNSEEIMNAFGKTKKIGGGSSSRERKAQQQKQQGDMDPSLMLPGKNIKEKI